MQAAKQLEEKYGVSCEVTTPAVLYRLITMVLESVKKPQDSADLGCLRTRVIYTRWRPSYGLPLMNWMPRQLYECKN
jgi:hypothetical protein